METVSIERTTTKSFWQCYDAPERGVGMPIRVECYAGHRGEETPRRFEIGDLRVDVVEVVDRWFEPEYRYFRVKGGNGKIYLLRYKTTRDSWELMASKSCFR